MPVTSSLSFAAKGDQKIENQGLETRAVRTGRGLQASRKMDRQQPACATTCVKTIRRLFPLTQIQGERVRTWSRR